MGRCGHSLVGCPDTSTFPFHVHASQIDDEDQRPAASQNPPSPVSPTLAITCPYFNVPIVVPARAGQPLNAKSHDRRRSASSSPPRWP